MIGAEGVRGVAGADETVMSGTLGAAKQKKKPGEKSNKKSKCLRFVHTY